MITPKSMESIKSNSLFTGLDFSALDFPFDAKNFEEFKEGDIIYSLGQAAEYLYLLISGEVKIKVQPSRKLILKSANDFFGETEVLEKTQRNSSALANQNTLIYKIDIDLINKILAETAAMVNSQSVDNNSTINYSNSNIKSEEYTSTNNKMIETDSALAKLENSSEDANDLNSKITIDQAMLEILKYKPDKDIKSLIEEINNVSPNQPEEMEKKDGEVNHNSINKLLNDETIEFEIIENEEDELKDLPNTNKDKIEVIDFRKENLNIQDVNQTINSKPKTHENDDIASGELIDSVLELNDYAKEPFIDPTISHTNNFNKTNSVVNIDKDNTAALNKEQINTSIEHTQFEIDETYNGEATANAEPDIEVFVNKRKHLKVDIGTYIPQKEVFKQDKTHIDKNDKDDKDQTTHNLGIDEFNKNEPQYKANVDLDAIEQKLFKNKKAPISDNDADSVIRNKYLERDDQSLKLKLIGDENDAVNWVITEGQLDTDGVANQESQIKAIPQNPLAEKFKSMFPPSDDITKTAKNVLAFILNKCGSQIGAIYLFSSKEQKLIEAFQSFESKFKRNKNSDMGITGIVVRDKKIYFAVHFNHNKDFNADIDLPNNFSGETLLFIPFVDMNNNFLGVAQIGTDKTVYSFEERKELNNYAEYCSVVLQQCLTSSKKIEAIIKTDITRVLNFIMQDIKTPLLKIKFLASSLSKIDLPESTKKSVSLLGSQINFVVDTLQSPVDYFENNSKCKLEVVSFNDTTLNVFNLLSSYIESRNVKLIKELVHDVKVKIDTRKFYVALYYISRFACDLMPQGGTLLFKSDVKGTNLFLSVKDENKIMDNKLISKVFEPDFTNELGESIGLSLSIAKSLLQSMNGNITLQMSNTGTNYEIVFPVFSL